MKGITAPVALIILEARENPLCRSRDVRLLARVEWLKSPSMFCTDPLSGIPPVSGRWHGSRPLHPLLGLGEGLKAKLLVEAVSVPGRKHDALQIQIFEQ